MPLPYLNINILDFYFVSDSSEVMNPFFGFFFFCIFIKIQISAVLTMFLDRLFGLLTINDMMIFFPGNLSGFRIFHCSAWHTEKQSNFWLLNFWISLVCSLQPNKLLRWTLNAFLKSRKTPFQTYSVIFLFIFCTAKLQNKKLEMQMTR